MRPIILFCLLPLLVTGCGAPPTQPAGGAATRNTAAAYLAAGNYNAAAEEYIRLAEKNKKDADSLLLQAASAYLAGDSPELAASTLARVKESNLTEIQAMERKVLYARMALYQNNTAAAIELLDFVLPADAPRALAAAYYRARGLAYEMDGRLFMAARARVQLAPYLDTEEELNNNNHSIWGLLSRLDVATLQKEMTGVEGELAGWIELAIIAGTLSHSWTGLDTAIRTWKEQHGSHPAIAQIIPEIYAAAEAEAVIQPQRIALLLPFADQYHDAATAIRDGFLAAWYAAPSTADKPAVRIYNTANRKILEVYNSAVADGADFIVGPLEKEAVATLLSGNNLPVRILALNQVATGNEQKIDAATSVLPSIFQFGLLPEDETVQAADRAWFNGLAQALIITPDSSWGDRIYNAFSSHWQQLGGRVIAHVKIPAAAEDLARPVKQLLNIDKSEQRAKELTGVLGKKIHFEPRHRQDADLIFMAASPVVARQLIPQFRFFGVGNMAIYSISSIYSGIPNTEADNDIDDVVFADMPWIVDPELQNSPLQLALNRNWDQNNSLYKRLYAFGIDAYRIIPKLVELFLQKEGNFNGATGSLTVTKGGYVQRSSTWVHMVKGTLQLLD